MDLILHFDQHLASIIQNLGNWSYLLLFLIIFCETGLVVTPFLPGDSLLFALGALAAKGLLNLFWLFVVLASAAIIGDSVNYALGNVFGEKILLKEKHHFFKKEHLERTHKFYEKYGGKTIVLARFVPIVRTFAPFVAGIGKMSYFKFLIYNVSGAFLWVSVVLLGGYFFCNIPLIKNNFSFAILAVILLSLLPVAIEFLKHRKKKAEALIVPGESR